DTRRTRSKESSIHRPSTPVKLQHLAHSFSSVRPYFHERHCTPVASLARFLTSEVLPRRSFGRCYTISHVLTVHSNDKYLYMGGPLLAGVTVVALSSLAPMALPLGTRALAITESISLYG